MKQFARLKVAILLAGLACGFNARASAVNDCSYNEIAARNVFALHTPALILGGNPTATSTVPKITLTGITTILGRKVAFLTIATAKAGKPPQFMMLAEGQSSDAIEVRKIDEKAGSVKIASYGREMMLDFPDTHF